eukprot:TRINITY_DN1465_c0_g1_i1.p1 TRINITY_DN1465_c0_g1~~TRINITY_DN1465_c0_g1_i1.p1  ORF type:complete len:1265 (-),score=298.77 TRINITY_DN1465_c0_g1_i1:3677-7471(-)
MTEQSDSLQKVSASGPAKESRPGSDSNLRSLYDEAQHQSEWLRIALSSIGDGVISTDHKGCVTFMNKIAEDLTGWTKPEAVGQPLSDVFRIINEQTRKTVANPALRALQEGTIFGLANHTILIARDGTERPIDDSAAPMRGEDGEIFGSILVFRDVTERKQIEQAQARLASIVSSSDDAIISKTLNGVIQTWNPGAERLFGYTAEEAIGQPMTLIIPPERHHEEQAILARLIKGERIDHFETVRVAKDGRRLDISLSISPLRGFDGNIIGASKVARDITGQKSTAIEQQRLAETLGLALSSADLGTWDWDPETDLIVLSPRAAEIYGVSPGKVYTREWMRSRVHPDHRDRARNAAAQAVASKSEYDLEYPLDGPADDLTWVTARGRGVYDAEGRLVRMLGIVQDTTHRKQAEVALRASERRHQFLAELAFRTQQLTDPAEIMSTTARMLAEHLAVDRCAYAEVADGSVYFIIGDFARNSSGVAGHWPVGYYGDECRRLMLANEPYVVTDANTDPRIKSQDLEAYHTTKIRAAICVPLHKEGKLTAVMGVHQQSQREWKPEEIELVRTVVALSWEAMERGRVARNLAESRSRLDYAVQLSGLGFWYCDLPFDVLRWDERVKEHFWLPPDATVTIELFFSRLHPDDRETTRSMIEACIRDHRPYSADYRTVDPTTGAIKWIRALGGTAYAADGTPIRFDGVTADITNRKLDEIRLAKALELEREQSLLLKEVADAALTLHSCATPENVVRVVADEAKRILRAQSVFALMSTGDGSTEEAWSISGEQGSAPGPRDVAALEQVSRDVRLTNQPRRLTRVEFANSDDWPADQQTDSRPVMWQNWLAVPLVNRNGKNLGIIQGFDKEAGEFTERDQSVLVQLAHIASVAIENAQLYSELRDGDRRKDEFLAVLAHELRNPLAPLRNGLQILHLTGVEAKTAAKAREMMDRQLSHMVRLIDDLLDISRISRNKMELRRSRVLLADIVSSAIETCRPMIEEAGHELTVGIPTDPVYLDADLTRLAQIFANLLANSVKYTPTGGHISLTAHEASGQLVVTIADSGIGIPKHALNSIFNMFSQVDRSIERSSGGLGIGLALVKGLVEMHGGTVEAFSPGEGRGSVFTVRLPIRTEGVVSVIEEENDELPDTMSRRRILVVDDNQDAATSMAMMLTLMENDVRVAHDGVQAVEVAEEFQPQVILMDVGMPRLNGYEATRRIREQEWGHNIAVIALTGWGQDADKILSREAGCNGHLVKPVNLPDLEKLLNELEKS